MIWLTDNIQFPDYSFASPEGILALGGDLSEERLLHAYKNGIFPWYSEGEPIVWYCPTQRMVLYPSEIKVSKSMRKILRSSTFIITENTCFEKVISNCKNIDRKDGLGTWITDDMEHAYIKLHKRGVAKSIEVWQYSNNSQNQELVGGLYGIVINGVFCGESMFSKVANASKIAFIHLAQSNKYQLIDCQVYNPHLASLGANEIERSKFLKILKDQSHSLK